MYFDDGEDPWTQKENFIRVFDFSGWSSAAAPATEYLLLLASLLALFLQR